MPGRRASFCIVLTSLTFSACSGLTSLETQVDEFANTDFSPTTRYAVVARTDQMHGHPANPFGDQVLRRIAQIVETKLGIRAEVLSGDPGSDWWNELDRAEQATGWVTAASYDQFMRVAGFDGYVLMTTNERFDWTDEPQGRRWYNWYRPVFHMNAFRDTESVQLMRHGLPNGIVCDLQGPIDEYNTTRNQELLPQIGLKDPAACIEKIAARFTDGLEARMPAPP